MRARRDGSGVLWIVLTGVALGVAHNALALRNPAGDGLPWRAEDPLADLATVGSAPASPPARDPYRTNVSDPLAVQDAGPAAADLPEIPAAGRRVQIRLPELRRYVDARAALVIDAREPEEYAESHIVDAINLPYDQVATDPARLEGLDTGGRPIVTYCGGGSCELSLKLADALISAGHPRVAVYMGGFPEWVENGGPVAGGSP